MRSKLIEKGLAIFLFFILLFFLPVGVLNAYPVHLIWQANVEPDIAGYIVYWGKESREEAGGYSFSIDVGNVTNFNGTVHCRDPLYCDYYYAVTCYDTEGFESDFSDEAHLLLMSADDDDDGDGLSYYEEVEVYGTNPALWDSNGDGISDGETLAWWGWEWNEDFDGDGIINLYDLDADGDSISNSIEIYYNSNPLSASSSLEANVTVYSDGTNKDRWIVEDNNPAGAIVETWYDTEKESEVIELIGAGWDNSYRLKAPDAYRWENYHQFVASLDFRTAEYASFYFELQTNFGLVWLQYGFNSESIIIVLSNVIRIGIGEECRDDTWRKFERSLKKDAEEAWGGLSVEAVRGFVVRGNCLLDNVCLKDFTPITIYSDGTNADRWIVEDSNPAGALVRTVFDEEAVSQVIELVGAGWDNSYRLKAPAGYRWENESEFNFHCHLKTDDENFTVYIELDTSAGTRWLKYGLLDYDQLGAGTYISYGLGADKADNKWHLLEMDLCNDLHAAQPEALINKVNGLVVRGNGRLDNINLKE